MRHIWVVAVAAAVLSACQTTTDGGPVSTASAPEADLPPNYRTVIRAAVRERFFDPYSIRDASISQPIAGATLVGSQQTVCVRANAKNRLGGYTGRRATAFTFRQGQLTRADNRYAETTCRDAQYQPFPEIEEGYKPPAADQKARAKG